MLLPAIATALSGIVSLIFQMHMVILTWKIHVKHRNDAYMAFLTRKRFVFYRKLQYERRRRLLRKKRRFWVQAGRTEEWWQNMIGGKAPEEAWKKNFRLPRERFVELTEELRPYISPNPLSPNYRALSTEKKLAVTLYYLKDTGSLAMTANTFGIAVNTASVIIGEVCKAITKNLGPKYIYMPRDCDEMREKVSEFEAKFGMIQAMGCIDGTHIPIKKPHKNSQDYFCYKQFYSLNVQAICDYRGQFMDVECVWPGSVHDAKVFANSSVNHRLQGNKLPRTFQSVIPGCNLVPNYLIGDPAYPLTPFCIKEYESCKNNEQVVFNQMLRSARNPVECAFGRLKARWSILTRTMDLSLNIIPTVVYACFTLHNFCEQHKTYIDPDQVQKQFDLIQANEAEHRNLPDPIFSTNTDEGATIRNVLTSYIYTCLPDHLT